VLILGRRRGSYC